MAGTHQHQRFARWLYDNVEADESGHGNCRVAPIPMRFGKRVLLCHRDRLELVRCPNSDFAEALFHLAAERLDALMVSALADAELLAQAS